jgi:hypothetical protein
MKSLLLNTLLLFQYINAMDTNNCNKLWGMSNNINNNRFYSWDIYMCETSPQQNINQDKTLQSIFSPSPDLRNLTELNKFLSISNNSTTNKIKNINNTTNLLNNLTNQNNFIKNASSPSTKSPSPSPYISFSPSFSVHLNNFSPSSSNGPNIKTNINTPSSSNDELLEPTEEDKNNVDSSINMERKIINSTNNSTTPKDTDNTPINNEDQPFFIVIIILSSIILLVIIFFLGKFLINRRLCKINKTKPEKEVIDLEIGAKNNKINNNKINNNKINNNKIKNNIDLSKIKLKAINHMKKRTQNINKEKLKGVKNQQKNQQKTKQINQPRDARNNTGVQKNIHDNQ